MAVRKLIIVVEKKYYGQGCKLWKASDLKKIARLEEQLWNIHLN